MSATNPAFEVNHYVAEQTRVALTLQGHLGTLWAANQTWTVELLKIGPVVYMMCPAVSAAAAAAANYIATAGGTVLPVGFRPTATIYQPFKIMDNSLEVNGSISIGSDGSIDIGNGATSQTTFTNAGNAGLYKQVLVYTTR